MAFTSAITWRASTAYVVLEIEGGGILSRTMRTRAGAECGNHATFVDMLTGCDAVICGGIGEGAAASLSAAVSSRSEPIRRVTRLRPMPTTGRFSAWCWRAPTKKRTAAGVTCALRPRCCFMLRTRSTASASAPRAGARSSWRSSLPGTGGCGKWRRAAWAPPRAKAARCGGRAHVCITNSWLGTIRRGSSSKAWIPPSEYRRTGKGERPDRRVAG